MLRMKYLRNLRQRMSYKNRFAKYLKYAIGEILLVVIGILIAIMINDWVKSSELKRANKVYLEKLIMELELNKSRMRDLISRVPTDEKPWVGIEQTIENNDSLLKMTHRGLKEEDIDFIVNNNIGSRFHLNLHTGIYDELISTGRLYTLGDDSLLMEIKNYYAFCDREDQYNENNIDKMGEAYDLVGRSYFKLNYDYQYNRQNFNLADYPWYFDEHSSEYQDIQLALSITLATQNNMLFKMRQIIQNSDSLIMLIGRELSQ